MIDEGLRCAGSGLAVQHSIYMNVPIFRAFHKGNKRACALYAAQIGCLLLVAENLYGIKCEIKTVMG